MLQLDAITVSKPEKAANTARDIHTQRTKDRNVFVYIGCLVEWAVADIDF